MKSNKKAKPRRGKRGFANQKKCNRKLQSNCSTNGLNVQDLLIPPTPKTYPHLETYTDHGLNVYLFFPQEGGHSVPSLIKALPFLPTVLAMNNELFLVVDITQKVTAFGLKTHKTFTDNQAIDEILRQGSLFFGPGGQGGSYASNISPT